MREKSKIILLILAAVTLLLVSLIPTKLPPISKVEVDLSEQLEFNIKLQSDADALLPLFDDMPSVPVFLKDQPIIKSGTNTERGAAYTNCEKHEIPSIVVKKTFYEKANPKFLNNILKHEMTHAWLCRQRLMAGHDQRFRQKFTEIGGFGN